MRCFFIVVFFSVLPALVSGQNKTPVTKSISDKIYSKVEVEAEFRGGVSAWVQFITLLQRI